MTRVEIFEIWRVGFRTYRGHVRFVDDAGIVGEKIVLGTRRYVLRQLRDFFARVPA